MKHRKDSEAGRTAVPDTASMPAPIGSDGTTRTSPDPDGLWWTLLAGISSLIVAIGIGRFAYTPILPAMQESFDLSNAAAGALASSNYLGYLVGAVLAALVPTGRAQGRLLRASLLVIAAATAAVALTTSFPAWLALRFLSGLTGAGVFVFASTAVLEEISGRGPTALSGRFYSGVGLGIALSGLVVAELNGSLSQDSAWRGDWLSLGALALAFSIPCWAWLPRGRFAGVSGGQPTSRIGEEAGNMNKPVSIGVPLVIALLCAAYSLEGGGYIVTGTFLPAIVEDLPGLAGARAGLWVLVGLAAAPSTLVWSWVASRLGCPLALILAYAAQAAGIVLPVVSTAWWAATGSAVLFGGTVMGIVALTLTYARQQVGSRKAGLAIGSLTAVYGIGQALGPLVAAALAGGPKGFAPALVAASSAVALGGLLMAVVWISGRNVNRKRKGVGLWR